MQIFEVKKSTTVLVVGKINCNCKFLKYQQVGSREVNNSQPKAGYGAKLKKKIAKVPKSMPVYVNKNCRNTKRIGRKSMTMLTSIDVSHVTFYPEILPKLPKSQSRCRFPKSRRRWKWKWKRREIAASHWKKSMPLPEVQLRQRLLRKQKLP
jgi:hypothetical protein